MSVPSALWVPWVLIAHSDVGGQALYADFPTEGLCKKAIHSQFVALEHNNASVIMTCWPEPEARRKWPELFR